MDKNIIVVISIEYIYTSHYNEDTRRGMAIRSSGNNYADIDAIVTEFEEKILDDHDENIKSIGSTIVRYHKNGLIEDVLKLWDWFMPLMTQILGPEMTNIMTNAMK